MTIDVRLDVSQDVCPMTFVRVRLALDAIQPGRVLEVRLMGEEARRNVPRTAVAQGHTVLAVEAAENGATLVTIRKA